MKEPFSNKTDPKENEISEKLRAVAEQTHATPYFVSELEEQLRSRHRPKAASLLTFRDLAPTLGWVALVLAMGMLLIWSIRTLVPSPQPAADETPTHRAETVTPTPESAPEKDATPALETFGYDWRQSKLYLSVPLPQSPAEAKLYVLKDEQPASIETAQALANQLGFQGEVYEVPGGPGNTIAYLVTDGKQRLMVQSDLHFDYYADYSKFGFMSGDENITLEQAATVIDAFLKSHGFDFQYQVEDAQQTPGTFFVLPLSPDGLAIWHDHNIPARLEFTIDENQQVIRVSSYQVSYEDSGGMFGIRSAEEAFQQVLDQSTMIHNGVLETMRSAGGDNASFWSRIYPDNQTITIFGQPTYYPAAIQGTSPFVSIGQWVVTGNVNGLENVDRATYVEATGQFITESGIRKFSVDSWQVTGAPEVYLSGSLRREDDQIILTADDGNNGQYVIKDAPADLPLNTSPTDEYLAINGFMVAGQLDWQSIQYYPAGSGGGGGGGSGTGFYKLNLSGTPVPFPSPTAQADFQSGTGNYTVKEGDTLGMIAQEFGVTVDELMQANDLTDPMIYIGQKLVIPGIPSGQSLVGQHIQVRGIFIVTTYRKEDGAQRTEYGLNLKPHETPFFMATLEGADLQNLQAYHNRPIDIWGTIKRLDQNGNAVIKVERYEIPFPDLQFQILRGKQRLTDVDGQQVALFTTTDGTTYAQLMTTGAPDSTILGGEGSDVLIEALLIPEETFGSYPALRLFSGAMANNPKDNQPIEMTITANQPNVVEETPGMENYTPPSATIEKVELVYYVPNPSMSGNSNPDLTVQYIQPAWRFYGHYSNGDEFEFLVQALKQEFLLPELVPYQGPG